MQITMMGILTYNRPYLKTVLGPMSYPLCPVELWQNQRTETSITRIV